VLTALLLMVGSGLLLVALVEEGVASAEPAAAGSGTPRTASRPATASGVVDGVVSPELADLQALQTLGVGGLAPGVGALEAGGAGQRRPDTPQVAAQLPYFWPGPRRITVQGQPREQPGGPAGGPDAPDPLLAGIPGLDVSLGGPQEWIHAGLARSVLFGMGYRQETFLRTFASRSMFGRSVAPMDLIDEVPGMFLFDALTQGAIRRTHGDGDWTSARDEAVGLAALAYGMHWGNRAWGRLVDVFSVWADPSMATVRFSTLRDRDLFMFAPRNPSVISLIAGGQVFLDGWRKTKLQRNGILPYADNDPHYLANLVYDGAAHFIPAAVFMGGLDSWLRWRLHFDRIRYLQWLPESRVFRQTTRIGYLQWLQESRAFRQTTEWAELRAWPAWARLSPLAYGLRAGLVYAAARVGSVLVTDPPPGAMGDLIRWFTQETGRVMAAPSREAPLELTASLLLNAGHWAGLTTLEALSNAAFLVPLTVYRLGLSAGIGAAELLGAHKLAQGLASAPGLGLMGQDAKVASVVAESRMGYASKHLVGHFIPRGPAQRPPAHQPPALEPPVPAPTPPAGGELVAQAGPPTPAPRVPAPPRSDPADQGTPGPATSRSGDSRSVHPRGGTRFPDRAPTTISAADLPVTPPASPTTGRRAPLPPDPGFGSSATLASLPWSTDTQLQPQAEAPAAQQSGGTAEPPVLAGELTLASTPRPTAQPDAGRMAGVPAGRWHIGGMEATVTGEDGERQVVVLPPLQPSDAAPPPVDAGLTGQERGERDGGTPTSAVVPPAEQAATEVGTPGQQHSGLEQTPVDTSDGRQAVGVPTDPSAG